MKQFHLITLDVNDVKCPWSMKQWVYVPEISKWFLIHSHGFQESSVSTWSLVMSLWWLICFTRWCHDMQSMIHTVMGWELVKCHWWFCWTLIMKWCGRYFNMKYDCEADSKSFCIMQHVPRFKAWENVLWFPNDFFQLNFLERYVFSLTKIYVFWWKSPIFFP